ncbi:MAG: acyl--CoA ligase, partial [Microthrixaceae bacterium]|nr:acyl--CoA ligase [Microthrixaceae bacterium]
MEVDLSLEALLSRRAAEMPDHPAMLEGDLRVSYRDLDRRVTEFAVGLVLAGVEAGNRVALLLEGGIEYVVAVFGIWRAGAIWVPLNPQIPDRDIGYAIELTQPRLVFTDDDGRARLAAAADSRIRAARIADRPSLTYSPEQQPPGAEMAGDAVIAFTSGTTGRSKGATITHRSLRVHSMAVADHYAMGPEDRILTMLPLYLLSIFLVGPSLAIESGGVSR